MSELVTNIAPEHIGELSEALAQDNVALLRAAIAGCPALLSCVYDAEFSILGRALHTSAPNCALALMDEYALQPTPIDMASVFNRDADCDGIAAKILARINISTYQDLGPTSIYIPVVTMAAYAARIDLLKQAVRAGFLITQYCKWGSPIVLNMHHAANSIRDFVRSDFIFDAILSLGADLHACHADSGDGLAAHAQTTQSTYLLWAAYRCGARPNPDGFFPNAIAAVRDNWNLYELLLERIFREASIARGLCAARAPAGEGIVSALCQRIESRARSMNNDTQPLIGLLSEAISMGALLEPPDLTNKYVRWAIDSGEVPGLSALLRCALARKRADKLVSDVLARADIAHPG
jgi:hypothetical protein